MKGWLAILIGWLIGSFFGVGQLTGMVRGVAGKAAS